MQGEIDSGASELAVMRTRVQTSVLTLTYRSSQAAAPDGVGNPLVAALKDVLRILVTTLAMMVRAAAWLAPWALVIGLIGWLVRKPLQRMRVRRQTRKVKPAPVDAGPPGD